MIIPNSVTVAFYGIIIGVAVVYFGVNYLLNLMDKWLGIESEN